MSGAQRGVRWPKRAFLYTIDFLPHKSGTGRDMRTYSNVRAYLDAGYEVEVVHVQTGPGDRGLDPDLEGARLAEVAGAAAPSRSLPDRLAYQVGRPYPAACNFYFRAHDAIRRAAARRESESPGAIHHFEYLLTAHVIPCLNLARSVWSCHEIPSEFLELHTRAEADAEGRRLHGWEERKIRFLGRIQAAVARSSSLVACISGDDCARIRREWRCLNADVLPFSVPDERPVERRRPWLAGGRLELLHVGQLHHFPTYRSLEFLFREVLPLVDPGTMSRLRLNVVGPDNGDPRCARIREMGAPYPQVKFLGRVEDLRAAYASSDLHLVASTHATGLRTRIVESFAFGVPVLASPVAASGIDGLPGEHLAMASTAEEFAAQLKRLAGDAGRLERLAREGRQLYERRYSRRVVADALEALLARHTDARPLATTA